MTCFGPFRPNVEISFLRRRDFLKVSFGLFSGLGLSKQLAPPYGGTADSVILLWMNGGPSHIDTFDPKPEAGPDYCGPYRRAIPCLLYTSPSPRD